MVSDRASQVLAQGLPPSLPKSFRTLADHGDVPRTTLQHRARGRRSLRDKAESQQYLTASEEKALVKFLIQQDTLGRPVRVKYVGSIAFSLARQRSPIDRLCKPPGKNWAQLFYKRHADVLKASKSAVLDWNRFNIYDKAIHWFDVIGEVLQGPTILQENVYNMDETGVMLSKPNNFKVLVSKDNQHGYRGARVKRTTVTAVECISADGRFLDPMIIWPASTHRADWVTHPTPGWHYAYSDSGYTDSYLSLQWLKLVFEPQTKERARQRPRILICDGFGTHETLEILEFCFENNIILCRLPSHTSHRLQPCDISVFGPLKAAYRDQVERLERGCVGTIGKEHFTSLYSPARYEAFTPRNIRAGWAKAGLFPLNPDRVLREIPKPIEVNASTTNEVRGGCYPQDQLTIPQTPVTPASVEAVMSLHNLIKQDVHMLDDTSKRRLNKHIQKLTNAAQLSFAERALLQEHNQFLAKINSEAKVRRSAKSKIIGTARVMSYEDLEKARAERAAKEIEKAATIEARKAKKTPSTNLAAEGTSAGNREDDWRGKGYAADIEADQQAETAPASQTQDGPVETMTEVFQAPVARMW